MRKNKLNNLLESLGPPKLDRLNFEIPKAARFSNRFLQIALAALAVLFLGKPKSGITDPGVTSTVSLGLALSCVSMVMSVLAMLLYTQFIFNNWSSRKVILLESFFDICGGAVVLVGVFNLSVKTAVGTEKALCKPFQPSPDGCSELNWGFAFMVLTFLTWLIAFVIDMRDVFGNLMASQRLQDDVELAGMESNLRRKMRKESMSAGSKGSSRAKKFKSLFKK